MDFERNFWNCDEENETFANHSRTHARMQALSDYSLVWKRLFENCCPVPMPSACDVIKRELVKVLHKLIHAYGVDKLHQMTRRASDDKLHQMTSMNQTTSCIRRQGAHQMTSIAWDGGLHRMTKNPWMQSCIRWQDEQNWKGTRPPNPTSVFRKFFRFLWIKFGWDYKSFLTKSPLPLRILAFVFVLRERLLDETHNLL